MSYPYVPSAVNLGRARGPRLAFIVHMAEGGGTVGYLSRDNPNGVSVHFVIERTGRIVQMLPLANMHTSIRTGNYIRKTNDPDGFYGAKWAVEVMGKWARTDTGTLGPNHASLAVEIEGYAASGPQVAQVTALNKLWKDMKSRYPGIKSLGHRDFASYKACPGKLINWGVVGGHAGHLTSPPETSTEEPVNLIAYEPGAVLTIKATGNVRTEPRLASTTLARTSKGEKVTAIGLVTGQLDLGSTDWWVWWEGNRWLYTHETNVVNIVVPGVPVVLPPTAESCAIYIPEPTPVTAESCKVFIDAAVEETKLSAVAEIIVRFGP